MWPRFLPGSCHFEGTFATLRVMPNNLSAHVTSFLAAVAAVLGVLHPGFVMPPWVEALSVPACVIGAVLLQLAHVNLKKSVAHDWATATAAVRALEAASAARTAAATTDASVQAAPTA